MAIELKVPSAGESITEVTIVEWLKNEGDHANADETIAVIETDKANVELPAPQAGTITKILKGADENAEVGEVIGYMEAGAAQKADSAPASENKKSNGAPPAAQPAAPSPKLKASGSGAPKASPAPQASSGPMMASPSVRRVMREKSIDPSSVDASGPGGRITYGDLRPPTQVPVTSGARDEERVAMTRLRRRIAERLVEAQQTAALLTTFNEVDMGPVMALRKAYKEQFLDRHGVKLGFMSFFLKAAV
ncbi:MAG: biotin/lipoyl-containing protein, partial [Myxococcota bacterium]